MGAASRRLLPGLVCAALATLPGLAHGGGGAAPEPAAGAPGGAAEVRPRFRYFDDPRGCRNLTLMEYPAAGFPRVLPLTRFCPFEPRDDCLGEAVPGRSKLVLREKPRVPRKDSIKWRLKKGQATAPADLGDPLATTDYELCVYVEVEGTCWLILHPDALAGAGWKARRNGFRFKMKKGEHPEGLRAIRLRTGADGKARIQVKGKGELLDLRALPMPDDAHVLVQLYNGEDRCWSTEFGIEPKKSTQRRFKDLSD